jgi:hypothetical protein
MVINIKAMLSMTDNNNANSWLIAVFGVNIPFNTDNPKTNICIAVINKKYRKNLPLLIGFIKFCIFAPFMGFNVLEEHMSDESFLIRYKMDGKIFFDKEQALSYLLFEQVIFVNSFWYKEDLPDDIQRSIGLFVNCGDVFAYACSDAEPVNYDDLEEVYDFYIKDRLNGIAAWCIKKRGIRPIVEVYESLSKKYPIDEWIS